MRPLKFELETVDNFRRGYREDKRNALQMERKQDSINKSPNYAQIFSCFALPRSKKTKKQTCGLIGWVQDIPEISAPARRRNALARLELCPNGPRWSFRPTVPALAASWRLWALAAGPRPPVGACGARCPPWRLPGRPGRWRWSPALARAYGYRARPGGFLEDLNAGGGFPVPGRSWRPTIPALAAPWRPWPLGVVSRLLVGAGGPPWVNPAEKSFPYFFPLAGLFQISA